MCSKENDSSLENGGAYATKTYYVDDEEDDLSLTDDEEDVRLLSACVECILIVEQQASKTKLNSKSTHEVVETKMVGDSDPIAPCERHKTHGCEY